MMIAFIILTCIMLYAVGKSYDVMMDGRHEDEARMEREYWERRIAEENKDRK